MTHKDLIDRVRVIIGDTEKVLIPDDQRIRALINFSFQKTYKRIGVMMKGTLYDVVNAERPELVLPSEFYRAKLVLVNGVEVNELRYEDVVKGDVYGINRSGAFNGVIQNTLYPFQVGYYFRNTSQGGRLLGISPYPTGAMCYEVFCLFDYVSDVSDSGSVYAELVPPMYEEVLLYGAVLEVLPELESYHVAERVAMRQKEYQADMLRLMGGTNARMEIMLPIQVQASIRNMVRELKMEYQVRYEREIKEVKRTAMAIAKLPPKRYAQGLLNWKTRASE